jgi:hypothetical protein
VRDPGWMSLGLALVAAGLVLILLWPPIGVAAAGAGLALITRHAPDRPKPRRVDEAPPFDLRRPRDALAAGFVGVGIAAAVGIYIAGPVLHPIVLTAPVALALIYVMVRRRLG